jgi:thermitase
VRAEYDSSGSLAGILVGSVGGSADTTIDTGFSLRTTADIFSQVATSASAMVEAERSIVISNYEERETADITSRTLKNYNDCKAVTFYVRRINEVYDLTTKIVSIRWRIVDIKNNVLYGWRDAGQVNSLPPDLRIRVAGILRDFPKVGDVENTDSCINLPTDGTFIESELAYCSSCDPLRAADLEISLERKKAEARKLCLEAELLSIEVERRKKELAQGSNVTG